MISNKVRAKLQKRAAPPKNRNTNKQREKRRNQQLVNEHLSPWSCKKPWWLFFFFFFCKPPRRSNSSSWGSGSIQWQRILVLYVHMVLKHASFDSNKNFFLSLKITIISFPLYLPFQLELDYSDLPSGGTKGLAAYRKPESYSVFSYKETSWRVSRGFQSLW